MLEYALTLLFLLSSSAPINCELYSTRVATTLEYLTDSPTDINVEVAADLSATYRSNCNVE